MLFVGEKFCEILKVGETIEDGLKTRKLAHVAESPRSSGLLKKKREDIDPKKTIILPRSSSTSPEFL